MLAVLGAAGGLALGVAGVRGADRAERAADARRAPRRRSNPAVLAFTIGARARSPASCSASCRRSPVMRGNTARAAEGRQRARLGGQGHRTLTRRRSSSRRRRSRSCCSSARGCWSRASRACSDVDPGFSADNVLTAQIALPATRYPDAAARRAFWARLVEQARALPGVTAVGLTSNVPFNGKVGSGSYSIVGYNAAAGRAAAARPAGGRRRRLLPRDADSARRRARSSTTRDTADEPAGRRHRSVSREAAISPAGARSASRCSAAARQPGFTIVGVVGTINSIDLGEPVAKERIYYPVTQQPQRGDGAGREDRRRSARRWCRRCARPSQSIDPEQPIADVRTMEEWMARSLERRRDADAAARAVRRGGADAVGDRHLRRARVRRGAARARVRHPAGARRRTARHPRRSSSSRGCGRRASAWSLGLAGALALRATCRPCCSASTLTISRCMPA